MKKPLAVALSAFAVVAALTAFSIVPLSTEGADGDDPPAFAISLDQIQTLNPAVAAHYAQVSPCVPHMGVHYAAVVDERPAMAPNVVLSVDPVNGQVTAVEIVVPADQPWQPWYDQPEGEPYELAPGMMFWTQHVYLVDHDSINECPPPTE